MLSWTYIGHTVVVVLVLWCVRQTECQNINTHIYHLSNLTPAEDDVHSPINKTQQDNSDKRNPKIINVTAGIQLSNSRGNSDSSIHTPKDTVTTTSKTLLPRNVGIPDPHTGKPAIVLPVHATTMPTAVTVKDEELGNRHNMPMPSRSNTHTQDRSSVTSSTLVNASTEVGNNPWDRRHPRHPAGYNEGNEESRLPSSSMQSSHEEEHRGL